MHSKVEVRGSAVVAGLLAALAAGCSDEGTSKLTVETDTAPVYLAAKQHGSSEWRTFPTEGVTSFAIEVGEAYEVVIVCRREEEDDDVIAITVADYLRTRDDGDLLKHVCRGDLYGSNDGRVAVRGLVPDANYLLFGPTSRTTTAKDINLAARVRPGTYDLLAIHSDLPSAPLTAAFRRDIQITGDVDLGTIDLSQAMRPLTAKTFSVENALADEELDGTFTIRTAGISALAFDVDGDGATVSFLPDELLLPTDQQVISFSGKRPASAALPHTVTRRRYLDPKSDAAVLLPEAPSPITFANTETMTSASWSSLPASANLWLLRSSPGSVRSWATGLFMSRSFAERTDASALALDTAALPGFLAEWNHRPEHNQLFQLTAYDGASPLSGAPGDASVTVQDQILD